LLLPSRPPLLPLLLPLQKEVLLKEVLLKKRVSVFSFVSQRYFELFHYSLSFNFCLKFSVVFRVRALSV